MSKKRKTKPKKKKFKFDWPNLLLGAFFGFLITFGFVIVENYNFQQDLKNAEPNISINIQEVSDETIHLEIYSNNLNGSDVEKLEFSFGLPGVMTNISNEYIKLIDKCEIYSKMHTGAKENSSFGAIKIDISQTARVKCNSIMPGGFYSINLKYTPTEVIQEKRWISWYGNLNYFKYSPQDFFDFEEVFLFWNFKGKLQSKIQCIDLSNLNYIKIDNERLVESLKVFGQTWNMTLREGMRNSYCKKY